MRFTVFHGFYMIVNLYGYHAGSCGNITAPINTTPNSPTAWVKPKIAAVKNPERDNGNTTVKKVSSGFARKVAAASKGASPIAVNAVCRGCTTNGKEYSTEATTRSAKVNGSVPMPNSVVILPTIPLGLINTSK
jgi:hypothetical protein